jgi:hypothetical protein
MVLADTRETLPESRKRSPSGVRAAGLDRASRDQDLTHKLVPIVSTSTSIRRAATRRPAEEAT